MFCDRYIANRVATRGIVERGLFDQPEVVSSGLLEGIENDPQSRLYRSALKHTLLCKESGSIPQRKFDSCPLNCHMPLLQLTRHKLVDASHQRGRQDELQFAYREKRCLQACHDASLCIDHENHQREVNLPAARNAMSVNRFEKSNLFKVLDCEGFEDDFYTNNFEINSCDQLVVATNSGICSVALQSSEPENVTELFQCKTQDDRVASLASSVSSELIAIAQRSGQVSLIDATNGELIRQFPKDVTSKHHSCIAWHPKQMSTFTVGTKDGRIVLYDCRTSNSPTTTLSNAHANANVCSMKWHEDGYLIVSGGNDNRVVVNDIRRVQKQSSTGVHALRVFKGHKAAVRALAWSPFSSTQFCSGAGLADRRLCFWSLTREDDTPLFEVETGSQVCSMIWTQHTLITSHGHNETDIQFRDVCIPRSSAELVRNLSGHSGRVLGLQMNPSETLLASVAGGCDCTVRLWQTHESRITYAPKARRLSMAGLTHKSSLLHLR